MEIVKERIKIRSFREEDIPDKVRIINDKKNNKFLHYDLPLKEDKTLVWFRSIKDDNERLDLTIIYKGKVAGMIGLLGIDRKNQKAEYYICVDYSFSGKGIGLISTMLLLEYAFSAMQLNRIYLYTEEHNDKAQHLFEKIGFYKEGLLKDDIIYNDKIINRYIYGICKEEYYAKHNNS